MKWGLRFVMALSLLGTPLRLFADLILPCTYPVSVTMKDGSFRTGTALWATDSFEALRSDDPKVRAQAQAYPRVGEVPIPMGVECGPEGMKYFKLWLDYSAWCEAKGLPTAPLELAGVLMKTAVPKFPAGIRPTLLKTVSSSFVAVRCNHCGRHLGGTEKLPFSRIAEIKIVGRAADSVPAYTLQPLDSDQLRLATSGRARHVIELVDEFKEPFMVFFYAERPGPAGWLEDWLAQCPNIPIGSVAVDGEKLWAVSRLDDDRQLTPAALPDIEFNESATTPLALAMQEMFRGFVGAKGQTKAAEWDAFRSSHWHRLSGEERSKFVPLQFDWYID